MAGFKRLHGSFLLLTLAVAASLPTRCFAQQVLYRSDVAVTGPGVVEYYKDVTGRLGLSQVTAAPIHFAPAPGRTVNFGFSSAAYWLRWSLHSHSAQATTVYLSLAQPTLDDVQLYVLANGVLQQRVRAGDEIPSQQRLIAASHPVLPITLAPDGDYQVYLRVAGQMGSLLVPMQLQSAADVERAARNDLLLNGVFAGVLGGLFAYNLFLYLSLRQRAYLYYVLLLPMSYLACTALNGFGAWMLYPTATWLANQGLIVFSACSFLLNMLFTRALLETGSIFWLDRLLLGIAGVAAVSALSPWLLPLGWMYPLNFPLVFLVPLTGALAGVVGLRRGHPQARFFLLAQIAVWSSLVGFGLTMIGVIHFSALSRHSIALGIAGNALLLSLALADRIRALQQAARLAQSATRRALEGRHQELERTVEERTRDLDQARRRAEYLATTDALTGVYNRRGLLPLLQQAIEQAARQAAPLSLISFDLDYFKDINDDFGHAEGDRVLCHLVALTRALVLPTDLFGRTGGEEFMLMLGMPSESAEQFAERLRQHVETHLHAGAEQRTVTASFGVAALGRKTSSLEALQRAADAALYRAKNRGRNRVEIYDARSNETTRTRAIMHPAPIPLSRAASALPATTFPLPETRLR